jgi:hypothetical protein
MTGLGRFFAQAVIEAVTAKWSLAALQITVYSEQTSSSGRAMMSRQEAVVGEIRVAM